MGRASREKAFITRPLPVLLFIALLTTLIYSNTFSSAFHFDDNPNIVENPRIKDLSNYLDFSGSRYVGYLSFALNYRFGGLSVFGYHLVNLLIHITNGFLVYSLVLLLFKALQGPQPPAQAQGGASTASEIALVTALLFIAHPIQTQAVTYIVQRFASLAALFYLLAVVCYLKWKTAPLEGRSRHLWYGAVLLSTLLAMKTKENSFTLPLMILGIEAVFFRPFTRRRWISLVPVLLTLLIIPLSSLEVRGEAGVRLTQQTLEINRLDYLFTQFRVVMTYLRLLVLPINQNLDYDYPIYHSLLDPPVFFSSLFLLSLFVVTIYLLFNSKFKTLIARLPAFGILWFFLTLSVESSIIPIRDVIFEHRVYLPSVGFFLCVAIMALHRMARPILRISFLSLILLLFSIATYQRNLVWKNDFTLWSDVVGKAPKQARGHHNLGIEYEVRERLEEAIQELRIAVKIKPDFAMPHHNLGEIFLKQGRLEEALREYQTAVKLIPGYAPTHNNLGVVYKDLGQWEEAIREYQTALRLKPDYAMAHHNLGILFNEQGRFEEAVMEYQTALRIGPDSAEIRNSLGDAYAAQKRFKEALQEYRIAVTLKPDLIEARNNLGATYADMGRLDDAIREFQAALQLQPNHEGLYYNLGNAYLLKGQIHDATRAFEQALQIKPDFIHARKALESLPR